MIPSKKKKVHQRCHHYTLSTTKKLTIGCAVLIAFIRRFSQIISVFNLWESADNEFVRYPKKFTSLRSEAKPREVV